MAPAVAIVATAAGVARAIAALQAAAVPEPPPPHPTSVAAANAAAPVTLRTRGTVAAAGGRRARSLPSAPVGGARVRPTRLETTDGPSDEGRAMSLTTPDRIRNVAVLGHSHDGKTTLCEALLHTAGATPRLGLPEQRTSILDADPEEQRRGITITSAVAHLDWKGVRTNLIDTPGTPDFAGQVAEALAAADGAVLCVAATGSVPVGTEQAIAAIRAAGIPALVVITRLDRENAAFEATVDALRAAFDRTPIAVAVPIGVADDFRGFVDLVDDRAWEFGDSGAEVREIPCPRSCAATSSGLTPRWSRPPPRPTTR